MEKTPQVVQEKITASTGGEKWKFAVEEKESDVNTREGKIEMGSVVNRQREDYRRCCREHSG